MWGAMWKPWLMNRHCETSDLLGAHEVFQRVSQLYCLYISWEHLLEEDTLTDMIVF